MHIYTYICIYIYTHTHITDLVAGAQELNLLDAIGLAFVLETRVLRRIFFFKKIEEEKKSKKLRSSALRLFLRPVF